MGEEEQERFEDYLELEQYIEQLHSQKSARLPANLAPQQVHTYSMALLFHTVSPRTPDLRPGFREQLYEHLRQQQQREEQPSAEQGIEAIDTSRKSSPSQVQKQFRSIYKQNQIPQPDHISSTQPGSADAKKPDHILSTQPRSTDAKKRKSRRLSRRTLFASGTIAASVLAGAGLGGVIEHSLEPAPPDPHPIIHENAGGTWDWYSVASVKALGKEAVPFQVKGINGYVIHQTDNPSDNPIIAVTSACPHMGCIVQWQGDVRQFVCPCHDRTFNTAGSANNENYQFKLTDLPRLETKTQDGYIYVKAPKS